MLKYLKRLTRRKPTLDPRAILNAALSKAIGDALESGVDIRLVANELERRCEGLRTQWVMTAPLGKSIM